MMKTDDPRAPTPPDAGVLSAFIGGQYGFLESANTRQRNRDYWPPMNADSFACRQR
jgi:hypothetical protein